MLALTVPTGAFAADSTVARIIVVGTGVIVTATYLRHQQQRLNQVPGNRS